MALAESLDKVAAHQLEHEPALEQVSQLEQVEDGEHQLELVDEPLVQLELDMELAHCDAQEQGQIPAWLQDMVGVVELELGIVEQLQRSSPQLEPARIFELPAHSVQHSVQLLLLRMVLVLRTHKRHMEEEHMEQGIHNRGEEGTP